METPTRANKRIRLSIFEIIVQIFKNRLLKIENFNIPYKASTSNTKWLEYFRRNQSSTWSSIFSPVCLYWIWYVNLFVTKNNQISSWRKLILKLNKFYDKKGFFCRNCGNVIWNSKSFEKLNDHVRKFIMILLVFFLLGSHKISQ